MSGTVSSTTSTSSTSSSNAASSLAALSSDTSTFLSMLTTQLQNQDPTSPVDATQFTTQLVQLSSVEQQIAANQNLEQLVALQQVAQVTSASGMIGKSVEVESNQLTLQNGAAQINLPAAGTASQAVVQVTDSSGKVLYSDVAALGSGATAWKWDGTLSNGGTAADGAYNVSVTGYSATGEATGALTSTTVGTVTAAQRDNGTAELVMGGLSVSFDKVRGLAAGS